MPIDKIKIKYSEEARNCIEHIIRGFSNPQGTVIQIPAKFNLSILLDILKHFEKGQSQIKNKYSSKLKYHEAFLLNLLLNSELNVNDPFTHFIMYDLIKQIEPNL